MDWIFAYVSPLGRITLASDGAALTGLWLEGQKHFGAGLSPEAGQKRLPAIDCAVRWLDLYFSGRDPGFAPPLAPRGTAFQKAVWGELLRIPFGATVTYGQLADRLKTSARAVGSAVARNPVSLIIPCHRVVGAKGALVGYAGGTERKSRLLSMEKAEPSALFPPGPARANFSKGHGYSLTILPDNAITGFTDDPVNIV